MTPTTAEFIPAFTITVAGVLGLAIGSFLNVVVHRVPAGRSLVSPPSTCPQCGSQIRAYDNVPVLSWLALRGKCRDCGTSISARYPLVELTTGAAFAAIAGWIFTGPAGAIANASPGMLVHRILELVILLVFAGVSISLTLIDLDTHRLPNAIVGPAAIGLGGLVVVTSLVSGHPDAIWRSAAGGAALFAAYLLLAYVSRGGMGLGDVKLAGVIGIVLGYFGWPELVVGAFAAFLYGGVVAIVLLALGRADRKTGVPFGPAMLLGAWTGLIVGTAVAGWYLSLSGVAVAGLP
ncbi:prepilin peptidase [Agromyces protaetiae]|uniref:Prepilin peptidase n=1 Tax=Agromyces protaetiae TaxID=2509455 RepID=A0A4P6FAA3_9MICO|nr:A24 family peptidase [Agromyces protaetiae]QAY73130.1 prepilin peptidase [Agromyces protaetiae]